MFGLASVLPVLLFTGFLISRNADVEREGREARILESTRLIAADIDRDIASVLTTLRILAQSPYLEFGDYEEFHTRASRALEGTNSFVLLLTPSYQQLLNTRVPFGTQLGKTSDPASVDEALRTRRPYVSNVFQGAVAGTNVFNVTYPIVQNGVVQQVLLITRNADALTQLLTSTPLDRLWKREIVDRDLTVMTRFRSDHIPGNRIPDDIAEKIAGLEGVFTIERAGENELVAYRKSTVTGWFVITRVPAAIFAAPLRQSVAALLIGTVIFLLLALILAWIFGRYITRPIDQLTALSRQLARQESFEPLDTPVREVNEVSSALSESSVALRKRSAALHESEGRANSRLMELESLYDTAPIGLAVVDPDLTISRMNNTLVGLAGKDIVARQGMPLWDLLPMLREKLEPQLNTVLRNGKIVNAVEIHETGTELAEEAGRSWLARLYPLTAADGKISGAGIILEDISNRRRAALANARLAAIVRSSADVMIGLSPDGVVLAWNRSAERLFGYTAEEIMGKSARLLYPPNSKAEFSSIYRALRKGETIQREGVRVARDGTLIDVAVTIAPIYDESEEVVGAAAIARDIRGRKQREEHLAFIMRELSHRTKNLLAIIQAIARQTADKSKNLDDFALRFSGRLQGLAHSHDLLVKRDWMGVSIAALVRTQLAPFAEKDSGKLDLSGPELLLSPEAAQPLGLAFHELATNASKYGAYTTKNGRVEVTWTYDQPAQNVTIVWRETGGPPVQKPKKRGFGSMLIEQMTAASLDGEVTIAFERDGLTCTFMLPDKHLASPATQE